MERVRGSRGVHLLRRRRRGRLDRLRWARNVLVSDNAQSDFSVEGSQYVSV